MGPGSFQWSSETGQGVMAYTKTQEFLHEDEENLYFESDRALEQTLQRI